MKSREQSLEIILRVPSNMTHPRKPVTDAISSYDISFLDIKLPNVRHKIPHRYEESCTF